MTPDQLVAKLKILRSFSFTRAQMKEFAEIAASERKAGFQRGDCSNAHQLGRQSDAMGDGDHIAHLYGQRFVEVPPMAKRPA